MAVTPTIEPEATVAPRPAAPDVASLLEGFRAANQGSGVPIDQHSDRLLPFARVSNKGWDMHVAGQDIGTIMALFKTTFIESHKQLVTSDLKTVFDTDLTDEEVHSRVTVVFSLLPTLISRYWNEATKVVTRTAALVRRKIISGPGQPTTRLFQILTASESDAEYCRHLTQIVCYYLNTSLLAQGLVEPLTPEIEFACKDLLKRLWLQGAISFLTSVEN